MGAIVVITFVYENATETQEDISSISMYSTRKTKNIWVWHYFHGVVGVFIMGLIKKMAKSRLFSCKKSVLQARSESSQSSPWPIHS